MSMEVLHAYARGTYLLVPAIGREGLASEWDFDDRSVRQVGLLLTQAHAEAGCPGQLRRLLVMFQTACCVSVD